MIRILDIDNCIADDSWRIPMIDFNKKDLDERYHNYHLLAAFDKVGNEDLLRMDDRVEKIVFSTARPDVFRAITVEWLKRLGIVEEEYLLFMRPADCHLPSVQLKRKILNHLIDHMGINKNRISGAYDDRPDVVEMYNSLGLNGQVRKIHDICAYTKPAQVQNPYPFQIDVEIQRNYPYAKPKGVSDV